MSGKKLGLKDKKKIKRRKRILAAAMQLFQTTGYADTTINDIAGKADVGVGTIYNYFSSKNEILLNIVVDNTLAKKPDEIIYENDAVQTLYSYLTSYLEGFSVFDREIWRGWFAALFIEQNLADRAIEFDLKIIDELAGICEKMQARGMITDKKSAAEIAKLLYTPFIVMMMGYIMVPEMDVKSAKSEFKRQVDLMFTGLRP